MHSTESTSSSDESAQPVNARTSLSKSRPLRAKASRSLDHDPSSSSSGQDSSDSESDEGREDTQVLSHAERRRQKKKDSKPSAKSKGNNRESHNKVPPDASASKQPKRQNSVWVGNLSFKTSADSLRRFFDGVGEITRIHMPTKVANAGPSSRGNAKENLGFAYVDFASPDAKIVAITMSENPLDGRRLLIKDGDDYTGRPTKPAAPVNEDDSSVTKSKTSGTGTTKTAQKILRSQKQPPGPTLFFGNLGFETTEASIREMLEHHHKDRSSSAEEGEKWIRKIRMGTFEDSGKCKGWAFVDFTTVEHSTTILTNSRTHYLNGRQLVVEYASPEAVRRGGGPRSERSGTQSTRRSDGPAKRKSHDEGEHQGQESGTQSLEKKRRISRDDDPRESRPRDSVVKHPGKRVRAKPGAALAQAKRETAAIVPSQGQKIVF